jgi:AraC family transcriptional regulator, arabinose operon regulatory protein
MTEVTATADYFSQQVRHTRCFFVGEKSPVPLVAGGCEWCRADFLVEREEFPFLALEFVAAGRGKLRLGSRSYQLEPGSAFLFDRTLPHRIESDAQQPLVKYFFNFTPGSMDIVLAELGLRSGNVLRVPEGAKVEALMQEAIDHTLKGTTPGLRVAQAALQHSLALCAESKLASGKTVSASERTFLRCRETILRHYPQLTTIQQAARLCNITAPYLTRLFQLHSKESPFHLLNRLRMTQAAMLLKTTNLPTKAIAAELHISSAAQFSRSYRAFHGVTPSDSRGE